MIKTFVISTKGGVGKTITSGNLAAFLAKKGNRVLAIDIDPQASLTSFFGVDKNAINEGQFHSTADVLTIKDFRIQDAIQHTTYERPDILPVTGTLREANDKILIDRKWVQHTRLRKALEQVEDLYAFAIMDSAPSHDMAVHNALAAADNMLVPIGIDDFSFEATEELLDIVDNMDEFNENLWLAGCFVNMFRPRATVYESSLAHLNAQTRLRMFSTVVRMGVAANEMTFQKAPIFEYAPSSNVAKGFRSLFKEYLARCKAHQ